MRKVAEQSVMGAEGGEEKNSERVVVLVFTSEAWYEYLVGGCQQCIEGVLGCAVAPDGVAGSSLVDRSEGSSQ